MNDINENTNEDKYIDTSYTAIISQVESFTKEKNSGIDDISSGTLYVKIPVVLADINIIFNLEADITLDRLAVEIKRIKKNVFLTQSSIIPFLEDKQTNTGILFIKGIIKNNIEYISPKYNVSTNENLHGNIRYCISETPFEFSTKITFIRKLVLNENTSKNEVAFSEYKISNHNTYSDEVSKYNLYDDNVLFTEIFIEKPFIELDRVDIIGVDINKISILKDIDTAEEKVTSLNEKSVVNLSLKVLQRQEVKITLV